MTWATGPESGFRVQPDLQRGPPKWSAAVGVAAERKSGAGDGSRTRDIQLGRLTLYRLSYSRLAPIVADDRRIATGASRAPRPVRPLRPHLDRVRAPAGSPPRGPASGGELGLIRAWRPLSNWPAAPSSGKIARTPDSSHQMRNQGHPRAAHRSDRLASHPRACIRFACRKLAIVRPPRPSRPAPRHGMPDPAYEMTHLVDRARSRLSPPSPRRRGTDAQADGHRRSGVEAAAVTIGHLWPPP